MSMQRRTFLKASVVTVGSVFLGVGCGGDDPDTPDTGTDTGNNDVLEDGSAFFPQSLASGDPRPESVILWTRVDDADASGDIELALQVSADETFDSLLDLGGSTEMMVTAETAFDRCVKVRLTGLAAATTLWYRFIYTKGETRYVSRVGRTKTAPAPDADVAVRFAYTSCQDYNGRYYNTYKRMNNIAGLDFLVHLGDYIYETTGDPAFQTTAPGRRVIFEDEAGAIGFHEGTDDEYFAARSLSNYRDLYKIYRSDEHLQQMHEQIPMIAVWDDHEFTNDAWGANSNYYGGREDELDVERRQNASKAWFEYMPVDYPEAPDFRYDASVAFPNDIRIYRDFRFGRHVHLVMTDLRSYRTDHLIPEGAFPGSIAVTEAMASAVRDPLPDFLEPYIEDIASYEGGIYKTMLESFMSESNEWTADVITGAISVPFINGYVARYNEAEGETYAEIAADGLPMGLSFEGIGKNSLYTGIGSRELVVEAAYQLYADALYEASGGTSETAMGDAQEAWFTSTMQGSDATWKFWGNEYMLTRLVIDLSVIPSLPDSFRKKFLMSAEDWAGMPNASDRVLEALSSVDNVVAITGDRHAFFSATPWVRDDPSKRIVEFTAGAISSATYRELLVEAAESDPVLRDAGASLLASQIAALLLDRNTAPSPHLGMAGPEEHGFGVVDVTAGEAVVTYHKIPYTNAFDDLADYDSHFSESVFRAVAGSRDMQQQIDGSWKRWDHTTLEWVDA